MIGVENNGRKILKLNSNPRHLEKPAKIQTFPAQTNYKGFSQLGRWLKMKNTKHDRMYCC